MTSITSEHVAAQLHRRLAYDPHTGSITFRYAAPPYHRSGDSAVRNGMVKHNHQNYPASKVAWCMAFGNWPAFQVSIHDGNPNNLSAENLKPRAAERLAAKLEAKRVRASKAMPALTCSCCAQPYTDEDPRYSQGRLRVSCAKRKNRHRMLARKYGLTSQRYSEMYAEQGGACALCREEHTVLPVDHCHTTGAVRKLLCTTCNTALGGFRGNPQLMRLAADYVENFSPCGG